MSFEAITTISDAENRARQIKADAQAAAAAAVEAAQAEGKAVIEAAVGKLIGNAGMHRQRAKSDEKAKADAETLAAETKNKEAAMRIKAKTNLDRAASLIVERIVNG